MTWENKNVNYWENPDCPRGYLEKSLIQLIDDVEGVLISPDYFSDKEEVFIRHEIEKYEYVSDK